MKINLEIQITKNNPIKGYVIVVENINLESKLLSVVVVIFLVKDNSIKINYYFYIKTDVSYQIYEVYLDLFPFLQIDYQVHLLIINLN